MATFRDFWEAAVKARDEGRLTKAQRVTSRDDTLPGFRTDTPEKLFVEVLGPIPTSDSGRLSTSRFRTLTNIRAFDRVLLIPETGTQWC